DNPALATQREKVRQLEQDLISARNAHNGGTASVPSTPPPPVAASVSEPTSPPLSRLAAFQSLKDQGASIHVSIFGGGKSPTALQPAAKTFFNLNEDE